MHEVVVHRLMVRGSIDQAVSQHIAVDRRRISNELLGDVVVENKKKKLLGDDPISVMRKIVELAKDL
jgi:hypothetical protein